MLYRLTPDSSAYTGVIKNSYPPSRAEMKNRPGKPSIAFSNKIYLNIIWKVSTSGINYLRLSESFTKINNVSFVLLFGHFDSLFNLTHMPLAR